MFNIHVIRLVNKLYSIKGLSMDFNNRLIHRLLDGFIVSCQPVAKGPMDSPDIITSMALASLAGGATGVLIEGTENIAHVRKVSNSIIIGIINRQIPDFTISITPYLEDVRSLAQAGANIITFDGTNCERPVTREILIDAIHDVGCLALAACSCQEDGDYCAQAGADIISTSLSANKPDFELIEYFNFKGYFVMAQGKLTTNEDVFHARLKGAHCITVGTILTKLEENVRRLVKASHLY